MEECEMDFPKDVVEFFAAYVKVDVECNIDVIVRKLE